ncbi:MAG: sulfatase [Lentisphaerae bacterium]|nr:sulfatase [Lentisphaerota bacterium]
MRRRDFLAGMGAAFTACAAGRVRAAARRTSLLILHTDEHNYRTLGCYRDLLPPEQARIWGPKTVVETPHIDSLAKQGALCTRFHATSPVCSPSRAAFVSGLYPHNTGTPTNDQPMKDDIVTFAEVLRREGYATGYAGKWHLDGDGKPQWAPARRFGFEDNRYMFNRGHWKKLEDTEQGPRVAAVDARDRPTYDVAGADAASFATDFLADRTIRFLEAHAKDAFAYMVSFPDPHGPNTVRAPYDTMFAGLAFEEPRTAHPPPEQAPAWGRPTGETWNPAAMARYFGMVKCIDDNVGRILAALKRLGRLEDTVVVFTSDHGDLCGEHGRHNKGVPFETSAGIPFVLRHPGTVKPGAVIRQALGTVDFKPTILGLLGVPCPGPVEGRDASALFTGAGTAPEGWTDVTILRSARADDDAPAGWLAAVSGRHKLIVSPTESPWLFDATADPDETRNLAGDPAARETVRTLARALRDYGIRCRDAAVSNPAIAADLAWAIEGSGPCPQRTPAQPRPARAKPAKAARRAAADEE